MQKSISTGEADHSAWYELERVSHTFSHHAPSPYALGLGCVTVVADLRDGVWARRVIL